ncbi:MAG: hypothetical protein ACUVTH_01790 [Thermogutta sp.]
MKAKADVRTPKLMHQLPRCFRPLILDIFRQREKAAKYNSRDRRQAPSPYAPERFYRRATPIPNSDW